MDVPESHRELAITVLRRHPGDCLWRRGWSVPKPSPLILRVLRKVRYSICAGPVPRYLKHSTDLMSLTSNGRVVSLLAVPHLEGPVCLSSSLLRCHRLNGYSVICSDAQAGPLRTIERCQHITLLLHGVTRRQTPRHPSIHHRVSEHPLLIGWHLDRQAGSQGAELAKAAVWLKKPVLRNTPRPRQTRAPCCVRHRGEDMSIMHHACLGRRALFGAKACT